MKFINRKEELNLFKKIAASDKAEFIIIYGRRRIGKSELINEVLKNNFGIKLLAREESEVLQLKRFSESLSILFDDEIIQKNPLQNWDAFFTYINKHTDKKMILAIDEFPYLVSENRSIPSILQDYWDNKLKDTKICLILCGSSISMMEKILGNKSPLYGRRTSQLLIKPFNFEQSLDYLNINFEDAIKVYSIFGGTPAYILEYDIKKNLEQNLKEKVLKVDSFLYRDVEFVLKEELREPRYYFSILSSIAKGNTKISDIINDTGLNKSIVGKYLSILSELMLINREIPILENPLKSRKGIHILNDNFFKFWFKFIYKHKEGIEKGIYEPVLYDINKNMNNYIGLLFENICKEALEKANKKGLLEFSKIGRWWDKDKEIDIIAINEKKEEILFCECKWKTNVNPEKIFNELNEKSKYVKWNNEKRTEIFAIFAKSFNKKIKEFGGKKIYCYDLNDIEKIIKS